MRIFLILQQFSECSSRASAITLSGIIEGLVYCNSTIPIPCRLFCMYVEIHDVSILWHGHMYYHLVNLHAGVEFACWE